MLKKDFIKKIDKWKVDFDNNFINCNLYPFYVYSSDPVIYLLQELTSDDKFFNELKKKYNDKNNNVVLASTTLFWLWSIYHYFDEMGLFINIDKSNLTTFRKEIYNINITYMDNMEYYSELYDSKKNEKRNELIGIMSDACISTIREYERFLFSIFKMDIKMENTQIFIENNDQFDLFVGQKREEIFEKLKSPIMCTSDKTWLSVKNNDKLEKIIIAMITKKKLDIIDWKSDEKIKFIEIPEFKDNPGLYFLLKKKNVKIPIKNVIDIWAYYYNFCYLLDKKENLELLNGFIKF